MKGSKAVCFSISGVLMLVALGTLAMKEDYVSSIESNPLANIVKDYTYQDERAINQFNTVMGLSFLGSIGTFIAGLKIKPDGEKT